MYRIGLFLMCWCTNLSLYSQMDLGIHLMEGTWQSTYTNPAFIPRHNVIISLPGLYNHLRVDNITYDDLVIANSQGQNTVDLDNAIAQLDPMNIIRDQFDVPTLAVGIRLGRGYLQIGHSFHVNAYMNYPRELLELAWRGNAQFIGQQVEVGPDLLLQAYSTTYVGLAGKLAEGLFIGGRFKVINGIGDLSTKQRQLRLFTDDDIYQTTLDADFVINSTGAFEYDGFENTDISLNDGNLDGDRLFSNNYGLGLDVGVQLRLEEWDFSASVLDLGYITWRENARQTRLQGTFTYDGLDVLTDVFIDTVSVGAFVDSLEAAYGVTESMGNYSTGLPAKFYFSGIYHFSERLNLGAVAYLESYRGELVPTFGLGANAQLSEIFSLGGIYTIKKDQLFGIGINSTLRLGPIQLLLATDNLLTAFRSTRSNSANFRVALNLVFGANEDLDINSIDDPDRFFR